MADTIKARDSNFELLRIVCIFLILLFHFDFYSDNEINMMVYRFIGLFGQVAVSVFILITGYFMVNKKLNLRRVLGIVFEAWTYSVLITFVMILIGKVELTQDVLWHTFLPITSVSLWFVTYYLILIALSPVLNTLLHNTSKNQLRTILAISFIVLSVIPTILFANELSNQILSFFFLYMVGAYIRLYPSHSTNSLRLSAGVCLSLFAFSFFCVVVAVHMYLGGGECYEMSKWYRTYYVLAIILVAATYVISKNIRYVMTMMCLLSLCSLFLHLPELGLSWVENICKYYTVLTVLLSVYLFLTFKNIKMGYSRTTNYLAASVFSVYVITTNMYLKPYLYNEIIDWVPWKSDLKFVFFYLGSMAAVMIAVILIDKLRLLVLKPFNHIIDRFYSKIEANIRKNCTILNEYLAL